MREGEGKLRGRDETWEGRLKGVGGELKKRKERGCGR